MKSRGSKTWLLSLAVMLWSAPASSGADFTPVMIKGHAAHPTRILAKVAAGSTVQGHALALADNSLTALRDYPLVPGLVLLEIETPAAVMSTRAITPAAAQASAVENLEEKIDQLRRSGLYEYVEPDYVVTADAVPTDARFTDGTLWGLHNTGQNGGVAGVDIDAVRAWDITTGSTDVIVAVIDSGIRYTHQDLAANMWKNPGEIPGNGIDDDGNGYVDDVYGINAITGSGDPVDDAGHGTHVAGTIGAAANNDHPNVGVAWNVRLMALKFLPVDGGGQTSDAIECINYAIAHGAKILNCSWGGGGFSAALRDSLQAARAAGVLVVTAAGNDGEDNDLAPVFPSSYNLDNIVSVAAIDRHGFRAGFSNFGRTSVDLGAPGVATYSTLNYSNTAYGLADGTSMAAPHVSGVAALVWARFPNLSLADARDVLLNTSTPLSDLALRTTSGGCVNAYAALTALPDGVLESSILPASESTLFSGRSVVLVVRVTDVTGVTGATVTGGVTGGGQLLFLDDGAYPDVTASDGNYTSTLVVPNSEEQLSLEISVTAPGKADATIGARYHVVAPPGNDTFDARIALHGKRAVANGTNFGATKETGEPLHAGNSGGASVWWTWTAPSNTTVTITTEGSNFDTTLAVYAGANVASLALVAANDHAPNAGSTSFSMVGFAATAGTAYQIAVDGFDGQSGRINLDLSTTITASNDLFAQAHTITGISASVVGDLLNSTRESGEPDHGTVHPSGSVWWTWIAPSNGIARLTVTRHLLAVYSGATVNTLTPVPSRSDFNGLPGLVFAAVAGTTYHIAVAWNADHDNYSSDFTLTLTLSPGSGPTNDFFANRTVLSGTTGTVNLNNGDATPEPGEPAIGVGATLWWTWIAPANGAAVFSLDRDSIDSALFIHTGATLESLTKVASNGGSAYTYRSSRAVFHAVAGTTYQIQFDARGSAGSDAVLSFELIDRPTNDHFADAELLTGMSATAVANNRGGTREAGEPFPTANGSGATLWWTWTAPASGTASISISTGYMAVYTGDSLDHLTRVAGFGPIVRSVVFHVTKGTTYRIWADGIFGYLGDITLSMSLVGGPPSDMFADRIIITGTRVIAPATITNATFELYDPYFGWNHGTTPGGSSWWSWTAPANGRTQISAVGLHATIVVGIGDKLEGLARVRDVINQEYSDGTFVFEAAAGTTYCIGVAVRDPAAATPFELKLVQAAAPSNDLFANRAAFSDSAVSVSGSNEGAYVEPYERYFYGEAPRASIWWSWTAPITGWVVIDTAGSNFDTNLGVYTGSDVTQLNYVAENGDTESGDVFSRVSFTATAGTRYQISVYGRLGATGSVLLSLSQHEAPANDRFANRTAIAGAPLVVAGNNQGATLESGEPDHAEFYTIASTVWWSWTAPSTGTATVSWDESPENYAVAVYFDSTLATLQPVESTRALDHGSNVTFHADAGATYAIAVGVREGVSSDFTFSISMTTPPPNDLFQDRFEAAGPSARLSGTCVGASRELGEPAGVSGWPTVWWKWTAPSVGRATLRLNGASPGHAYFAVFFGDTLGSLTLVTESLQSLEKNYLVWNAQTGTEYQIKVGTSGGAGSGFTVDLVLVDPPPNDDFSNRIALTGIAPSALGTNLGAGGEPGEPYVSNHPEEVSVWWTWTAPLGAPMVFSTTGSDFDTTLSIYTGNAVDSLTRVVTNDNAAEGVNTSRVVLEAVAGTTYQIAVTGTFGAMGAISLSGTPGEPPLANSVQLSTLTATAGMPLTLSANPVGAGPFTYQWLLNGTIIPGATSATLILSSAQAFSSGIYSVRVGNAFGESLSLPTELVINAPRPSDARLMNLSTRALGLAGEETLIPGFAIAGVGTKRLLVRGVGPQLAEFGVAGAMPDPRMTLKRLMGDTFENIASNNDWSLDANAAEIAATTDAVGAFPLADDSLDAALLVELEAGQYTVVTDDTNRTAGVAIVELYDADLSSGSELSSGAARLVNLSNRGYVGTGADVMIPGFAISNEGPKTVLLRAVGPKLADFGVTGFLADPRLTVYRTHPETGASELILSNDNWGENGDAADIAGTVAQVGAFELDSGSNDAAFVITLLPGVYTVHASGTDGGTGVALVEIYVVE